MPYKVEVTQDRKVTEHSSWSANGLRFAERWEAAWYERDLGSRWFGFTESRTTECDDPVTCHVSSCEGEPYSDGQKRAVHELMHVPNPDRAAMRASLVVAAIGVAGSILESYRERCVEPSFMEPISARVLVDRLPSHVRLAVQGATREKAVQVEVCYRRIVVSDTASQGNRKLVITTVGGKTIRESGSWGGSNPFEKSTISMTPVRTIPEGDAIIEATTGNLDMVYCIYIRPFDALAWLFPECPDLMVARDLLEITPIHHNRIDDICRNALARELAAERVTRNGALALSCDEKVALGIFQTLNSAGRKRALAENPGAVSAIDRLASLGLIKRSKSGAITVTPEGKTVEGLPRYV